MKKISILLNNIKKQEKYKSAKKHIIITLSVIVAVATLYVLMNPAITLNVDEFKLNLEDSFITDNYSWKNEGEYSSSLELKLTYENTDKEAFNGKNIILKSEDMLNGFVFSYSNNTEVYNILEKSDIEIIETEAGTYTFDHAEVLVNNEWHNLVETSSIWCKNCMSEAKPENDDYGWYANYGSENTEFKIDATTEYKLIYTYKAKEIVTDSLLPETKEAEIPILTAGLENARTVFKAPRNTGNLSLENSVDSLGNSTGITFTMHNYTGDNTSVSTTEKPNVNANGLFGKFSFRDSADTAGDVNINATLDADGFGPNHIRVNPILTATNNYNPVFNCQGQCTGLNTSLGYLFGEPKNAVGADTVGVTSYSANNTLLKKKIKNGVEYYSYSSNENAVDYDTTTNNFILRNYVERGYTATTFSNELSRFEFLPFNTLKSASNPTVIAPGSSTTAYNYESATDKTEIDHWYGMTMAFEFYMPKNGLINGQPMEFSFSGDDDVWVFIDDILVLDLGGTHGSVDGTINFSTGVVESYLNWDGVNAKRTAEVNGDTATDKYYLTSIHEMYENAATDGSGLAKTQWNGNIYQDYTKHKLKFFYLERGAAVANCKIEFNIPVLPAGSLSVKKEFDGVEKYNDEYTFAIRDVTNNAPIARGTKYTIGDNQYTITNDSGEFTLHNNEVAIFLSKTELDDPNGEYLRSYNQYYVQEINTGSHSEKHACAMAGVGCSDIDKTNNFTITPESKYLATFTNKTKTYNLNLSKEAINSYEGEKFDFMITMKDEFDNSVNINNLVVTSPNGYTIDQTNNGIIRFQLETAQNITINNIPINTIIEIKELDHDGYHTSMKLVEEGGVETPLVQDDTYTINMISENKDIKVYNTPGVVLPETGGIGTLIYIVVGLGMVLASTVLSIAYLRSTKIRD